MGKWIQVWNSAAIDVEWGGDGERERERIQYFILSGYVTGFPCD